MRQLLILLLIGGMAPPVFAAKRTTVEQLEQTLAAHGKSDAEVARQLSDLELTERLEEAKRARLQAELPGPQAKQALVVLADSSAFLDLPAGEIPAAAAPDLAEQRRMIALTIIYVSHTLRQLPNFSATRVTVGFQDMPQGYGHGGTVFVPAKPLRFVAESSATVLYRDGGEVVDVAATKDKKTEAGLGLRTAGEFGPILVNMLVDAAHGKLAWSHWEQGEAGPAAVFRYSVSKEQSHYEVSYCCVANPGSSFGEMSPFHEIAGYRGEFAIDPATGAVLRVTLKADLKSTDPIVRADMLVEYGPVEIGGKSYICPVKSVSISLAEAANSVQLQNYRRAAIASSSVQYSPGHLQTRLNDVSFAQYHLFRAAARLVAENAEEPAPTQAPSAPAAAVADASAGAAAGEDASSMNASSGAPAATASPSNASASSAPAEVSAQPSGTRTAAPTPAEPEFTPPFASPSGGVPVFKAGTEAVVVDVVVTKGNNDAVLNLRKENFEVMEDGKPQSVDLFEEHTAESAAPAALPPTPANVFTNQPVAPPGASVNALLLDSLNTPKPDQAFVHQQILNFLKNMQPGTRVAIFALGSKLRYIQGFTDDPALLRAALNDPKLMKPESSPASRTPQGDVDDAEHIKTMEMMNGGHLTEGIKAVQQAQSDFAAQQGGEAEQTTLAALRRLALYLAGIPGRKNLIWFSSTFPVTIFPSEKENNSSSAQRAYGHQIKETADVLTSSKVAIYPVSAEGMMMNHTVEMQADMAEAIKTGPMGEKSDQMADYSDQNSARAGRIAAMEQLASETGGEAIFNTNDLNKVIARVFQNGSHYYTLVYSPTNKSMDGKYRRIEVKVNGGRYKVAYRHGYYGDQAAMRNADFAAQDDADADPLRPLLGYGLPSATQLLYGVRVLPASTRPDEKAERAGGNNALTGQVTRYTIDFMIRWTDVDLDTTSKGTRAGKIQVGAIAYDRDGRPLNWIGEKQLMNLNAETYAAVQRSGIPASLQLDVPPEAVYLQTGIYDWGSKRAGTLQVPVAGLSQPATASLGTEQKK